MMNRNEQTPLTAQPNNMSIAALVCSILGLLLSICGLGLMFGSLAIILAILSKRSTEKYATPAIFSFVASGIGMVISTISLVVLLTFSFKMVNEMMQDPDAKQKFFDMYEDIYGIDLESELEQYSDL